MLRQWFAFALALVAGASLAQAADSTTALECRRALDGLQAHEEQAAAGRKSTGLQHPSPADQTKLAAMRKDAARICLGSTGDPLPTGRRAYQPPISVSPIVTTPARQRQVPPSTPVGGSPRRGAPAVVITSCDALGCWASDGTRLQRAGPNLLGPSGFCTVQGTVLLCP